MGLHTHTHTTACPLDCPDACSLVATVQDQKLVKLDGDERNTQTQGFICAKVRRFAQHLYHEERLLHPAVRVGAKGQGLFKQVSWDHALEHIATKLKATQARLGGEAILPLSYGGSNGLLTEGIWDARFFRRLGASQLGRTVCAAPSGRAHQGLYGKIPGVPIADFGKAELIVIWGFNANASGIHLVPEINAALAGGAKLVVIDPRQIPLARKATQHLALKPGTDLVLALAVVRWLVAHELHDAAFLAEHSTGFEDLRARAQPWSLDAAARECGLSVEAIETFAKLYASASPALIRMGWGPERCRNGGSASAAILSLPAVAGKFMVPGGGFVASNSRVFDLDLEPAIAQRAPNVRTINMNEIGHALTEPLDPPIAALFVYNCNPLATLPAQTLVRAGLEREDLFCVGFDQVMTDTARYADVLLPATTFLEHDDLKRGYGTGVLSHAPAVLDPVGSARPNYAVFHELMVRMGLDQPGESGQPATTREQVLNTMGLSESEREHLVTQGVVERHRGSVLFCDAWPRTPDKKVHLFPRELDEEAKTSGGSGLYAYRPDPGTLAFPLALISPASERTISSTFGQLQRGIARARLHPQDAAVRNIVNDAQIRLFNAQGEVICLAQLSEQIRPGVIELAKGLWARHTINGNTSNALCPAALSDLGGGATFNDARVEVELTEV